MILARWSAWHRRTANRRILAAMVTVGGLTLAVRAAGFVKELLVARQFGTGDALDAFLIALLAPGFCVNVLAGALAPAFMPIYVRARERGDAGRAQVFASEVLGLALLGLAAVTALLALGGSQLLPILGSSFDAGKLRLTRGLFFILLPYLILGGFSTLCGALLNAAERFAAPALAPLLVPAAVVTALLAGGPRAGIRTVGIATLAGMLAQSALLAWAVRRQGFSLRPRWRGLTPPVREFLGQYGPVLAGILLTGSADLVDQSMAAMLGPGSVATLVYGGRIVSAILGLATIALGTAVLPHFSAMVARADWAGLRHTLKTYTRLVLLWTVPAAAALVLLSRPLVRLVFERGAFTARDTVAVAQVQALFALQAPFYTLGVMGVRLLSALGRNRTLLWISLVNLAANVAGNYLLMSWLGVAGIALSTSLVYLLSCLLIGASVARELRRHPAG